MDTVMGTAIAAIGLIAVVALIIRSMLADKKKGRGCAGDCSHCNGRCH